MWNDRLNASFFCFCFFRLVHPPPSLPLFPLPPQRHPFLRRKTKGNATFIEIPTPPSPSPHLLHHFVREDVLVEGAGWRTCILPSTSLNFNTLLWLERTTNPRTALSVLSNSASIFNKTWRVLLPVRALWGRLCDPAFSPCHTGAPSPLVERGSSLIRSSHLELLWIFHRARVCRSTDVLIDWGSRLPVWRGPLPLPPNPCPVLCCALGRSME